MKKLISIPIVTGYVYILTVVAYYGFNSYFNIPATFIEFSVKNPIIFFFDLSRLIFSIFGQTSVSGWMGIIVFLLVVVAVFLYSKVIRVLVTVGFVVFLVWLPFGFYKFGNLLASVSTNFYTAPSSCIPGATEDLYIAPALFDAKAIFVPISASTLQIKNGLLIRDTSSLTCEMHRQETGRIKK